MKKAVFLLLIAICILNREAIAQGNDSAIIIKDTTRKTDSIRLNKKRLVGIVATGSAVYAGTMTGLYFLWYADYSESKFHFFNDNNEWFQLDKIGHSAAGYYISRYAFDIFRWTGLKNNTAVLYGTLSSFICQTGIEIFDGFSDGWGFSYGDFAANIAGDLLFASQQLWWKEQRITMKWSCHPTRYAQYRPDLLGKNWPERITKDYNGNTIWLSLNIHSFLPDECRFPRWLNVSVGYGAEGMTGARSNPLSFNGETLPLFKRYRQFYLSADIDLTKIRTNKKWLKVIFNAVGFLKIPAPAIEFNSPQGVKFHYLYF